MRDNSVRQVATDPFGYYATRDLKAGDEVTSAFGANYWLAALRRNEHRPATRLLLCIAQARLSPTCRGPPVLHVPAVGLPCAYRAPVH